MSTSPVAYNGARSEWPDSEKETWRSQALPNSGSDDITQEQFDQLLLWLNPDREKAAAQYEWIRKRLIKIFVSRGSHRPEELADQTINRVAWKLPEIQATYVGEPAHYFSGVASFIFRESLRRERVVTVVPEQPPAPTGDEERDYVCLDKCLAKLPGADRDLAIAYYLEEKQAKIDHRKKLAERLGLAVNALRIRACRIRAGLSKCVELCRSESS
jgi:DNA-directed RNA polymerase specialized sigma24 family protein